MPLKQTFPINLAQSRKKAFWLLLAFWTWIVVQGISDYRSGGMATARLVSLAMIVMIGIPVTMSQLKLRLKVDEAAVSIERLLGRSSFLFAEIGRLTHFRHIGSQIVGAQEGASHNGTYVIETRDGRSLEFIVPSSDGTRPDLGTALAAVAERTGLPWTGRTPPGAEPAGLWEFLRAASGRGTRRGMIAWLLASGFRVRPEIAGIHGQSLRWVMVAFVASGAASALVAFFPLLLKPSHFDALTRHGRTEYTLAGHLVWIPFALSLVAVTASTLGANVLLALVRFQRRGREALEAQLAAAREAHDRLIPADPPCPGNVDSPASASRPRTSDATTST